MDYFNSTVHQFYSLRQHNFNFYISSSVTYFLFLFRTLVFTIILNIYLYRLLMIIELFHKDVSFHFAKQITLFVLPRSRYLYLRSIKIYEIEFVLDLNELLLRFRLVLLVIVRLRLFCLLTRIFHLHIQIFCFCFILIYFLIDQIKLLLISTNDKFHLIFVFLPITSFISLFSL